MFWKRKQSEIESYWDFMRLRIYESYLLIGCGGKDRQALPILKAFTDAVNNIRALEDNSFENCELCDDGGYIYIKKLKGFSNQAGWMLVGMLKKDGWKIHKFIYESSDVQLIDMLYFPPEIANTPKSKSSTLYTRLGITRFYFFTIKILVKVVDLWSRLSERFRK